MAEDRTQPGNNGSMSMAQALENKFARIQKNGQEEKITEKSSENIQYACRNKGYLAGWNKFYEGHRVYYPEHRMLLAEVLNPIPTYEGMRFEYDPIKKSDLVRYLKMTTQHYGQLLEHNSGFPENPELKDIVNLMKTRDPPGWMDLEKGDLERGNLGLIWVSNTIWLPRPQMIARWLTDKTAEIYLQVLDTIESEAPLKEIMQVRPGRANSQLDPRLRLAMDNIYLSEYRLAGIDVDSYLKEISPKLDALSKMIPTETRPTFYSYEDYQRHFNEFFKSNNR